MDDKAAVDGVVNAAAFVNTVLVAGAGLAGTIVLLKLLRKDEFEIWHVTVKLRNAWAIFLLFTGAHLYFAIQLVIRCVRLFYDHHAQATSTFDTLTNSGSLFFLGMLARLSYKITSNGTLFIRMSWKDPVTWLSYGVAVLILWAVTQWRDVSWRNRVLTFSAALLIVGCNWVIGSNWVCALSELTLPQDQSVYLVNWQR